MVQKELKKSISANIADAKKTVSELLSFLENEHIPLSEDDLFDLKLVFSELIYNAVIHGNKENSSKKVEIDVVVLDDSLSCVISDEGEGFDYNDLITNFCKENDELLFDEHGRGVRLALSLVDELKFNETGNSIKFLKRLRLNG